MAAWVDAGEDVLLYGRHDRGTLDYFRERASEEKSRWNSGARERYEHVREKVITGINIDDFNRRLRAVGRKIQSTFRKDVVRQLLDIADLQHPPGEMVKYIRANPKVRERMRRNECDGWSSHHVQDKDEGIGDSSYWYRRATNGVYRPVGDGCFEAKIFFDTLVNKDDSLRPDEQFDIMHTWDLLDGYFNAGDEDPTSKFNAKL